MTLRSGGDRRHSSKQIAYTFPVPRAAFSSAVSCKPAFTAFYASLLGRAEFPENVRNSLHDKGVGSPG
jgi:hypothetical protein